MLKSELRAIERKFHTEFLSFDFKLKSELRAIESDDSDISLTPPLMVKIRA